MKQSYVHSGLLKQDNKTLKYDLGHGPEDGQILHPVALF
jgi:hypothetical protein